MHPKLLFFLNTGQLLI